MGVPRSTTSTTSTLNSTMETTHTSNSTTEPSSAVGSAHGNSSSTEIAARRDKFRERDQHPDQDKSDEYVNNQKPKPDSQGNGRQERLDHDKRQFNSTGPTPQRNRSNASRGSTEQSSRAVLASSSIHGQDAKLQELSPSSNKLNSSQTVE